MAKRVTVPIGRDAECCATLVAERRVLVMAHTMTYAQRLFEIVDLFSGDLRVQLVFTVPPDSFNSGVERYLEARGVIPVQWEQARDEEFDLAITAGVERIAEVNAPIAVFSHGASRNKLTDRRVRAGVRLARTVSGLSPYTLIDQDVVVPSAVVLAHEDELALLAAGCPDALPVAVVAGDPCYDRIVASVPRRSAYRNAFGIDDDRALVVVCSTWTPGSLLASSSQTITALLEQLPASDYTVALLTHPNIWAAHGAYQMRTWFRHWRDAGLVLVPPESDWKPFLVAADWIVGDHGSVTLYGAMVGVPMLTTRLPEQDVWLGSGARALSAAVPTVSPLHPMTEQLAHARYEFDPEAHARVAARITSEPGRFTRNASRALYGLLRLSPPASSMESEPARLPLPLSAYSAGTAADQ